MDLQSTQNQNEGLNFKMRGTCGVVFGYFGGAGSDKVVQNTLRDSACIPGLLGIYNFTGYPSTTHPYRFPLIENS